MTPLLSEAQVVEALREHLSAHGARARFARLLSMTPAMVTAVLRGRKRPSARMVRVMGLERVVMYREVGGS